MTPPTSRYKRMCTSSEISVLIYPNTRRHIIIIIINIKLFVTIPVTPIITDIIIHFMFHIRCISTNKHYYYYYYIYRHQKAGTYPAEICIPVKKNFIFPPIQNLVMTNLLSVQTLTRFR